MNSAAIPAIAIAKVVGGSSRLSRICCRFFPGPFLSKSDIWFSWAFS
jgi:hypothetical protein